MKIDPKDVNLRVYYHPLSLDCYRNKKIFTEIVNISGLDIRYINVEQWDKKEIKEHKVDTVPRTYLFVKEQRVSFLSGWVREPQNLFDWINTTMNKAGYSC